MRRNLSLLFLGLAIATPLVVGTAWGTRVAGGSDSWGYVSQAISWSKLDIQPQRPAIHHAPWPKAAASFTPLGYSTTQDGKRIVPTYAPGLPLLMSLPYRFFGLAGVFLVVPFFGDQFFWGRMLADAGASPEPIPIGELTSEQVAALEIVAGGTVVAAVAEIEDRWPAEVAGEESSVIDDLLGPFRRRADKALEAARAAGLGESELEQLRAAWATALQQRRPDEPVIAVPSLPAALATAVTNAAVSLDATATPFADDPSLRVDVAAPITYKYLADHCPDLAASGVGDAL